MKTLYLVTGSSGHVGSTLVRKLISENKDVRVFVLPQEKDLVPEGVEIYTGDITDKESLRPFFETQGYEKTILIHVAGIVSLSSDDNPLIWNVNYNGTKNVLELSVEYRIDKFVYVSSVDIIPEKRYPEIMKEIDHFDPEEREGQYAKSKAAASQLVLDYAKEGLDASLVQPTGIIGPGDERGNNHAIKMIRLMYKYNIPFYVEGGYDFVDVRDVADGTVLCAEKGKAGECYILSGDFISAKELIETIRRIRGRSPKMIRIPIKVAAAFAPLAEKISKWCGDKHPAYTPYAIDTVYSACHYTHEKASHELGYRNRDLKESIRDSI